MSLSRKHDDCHQGELGHLSVCLSASLSVFVEALTHLRVWLTFLFGGWLLAGLGDAGEGDGVANEVFAMC